MRDTYLECHKIHKTLDGKSDGCQEFMEAKPSLNCGVCGCHRNFHRKAEVVYGCHKIHTYGSQASVDGCQDFKPERNNSLKCSVCFCDTGFHRHTLITYNEDDFKKITAAPENVMPEIYDGYSAADFMDLHMVSRLEDLDI